MSLLEAVVACGALPAADAAQSQKKRFSEVLSSKLAVEVADGLRAVGFPAVRPVRGGPGERAFQGGLGPKRVDVTYSDEQHGLLLAVTIKSINSRPYGKNLKNRFADLCTEAITLHMRFPYAVVCAMFAFPAPADEDITEGRRLSTFRRAAKSLSTISGREEYTDPGEKFEHVAVMLFQPVGEGGPPASVRLFDATSMQELTEHQYFTKLRDIYNLRNPHAAVGDDEIADLDDS